MIEKRKYYRIKGRLEARWESASGSHASTISDVSIGGCYLETISHAAINENIRLQILLPTGSWLSVRGQVRYEHDGIGFGVQFWPLKPLEFEIWRNFLSLLDETE